MTATGDQKRSKHEAVKKLSNTRLNHQPNKIIFKGPKTQPSQASDTVTSNIENHNYRSGAIIKFSEERGVYTEAAGSR